MNSGWTSSDRVRLYRRDSKFGIPYGWAGYWNIGRNVEYATDTWSALPPLYYVWNRHYHTALGRWLTPDPLGLWGDPAQRGNPYQYCGNVPTLRVDPLGLLDDEAKAPEGSVFETLLPTGDTVIYGYIRTQDGKYGWFRILDPGLYRENEDGSKTYLAWDNCGNSNFAEEDTSWETIRGLLGDSTIAGWFVDSVFGTQQGKVLFSALMQMCGDPELAKAMAEAHLEGKSWDEFATEYVQDPGVVIGLILGIFLKGAGDDVVRAARKLLKSLPLNLTQDVINKTRKRHWHNSSATGVSKFDKSVDTDDDLRKLLKEAQESDTSTIRREANNIRDPNAPRVPSQDYIVIESDLGRTVGTTATGTATSRVRIVYNNNGDIISAYPIP